MLIGISILFFINFNLLNVNGSNTLNSQNDTLKQIYNTLSSKESITAFIGLTAAVPIPFILFYFERRQKRQNLLNEIINMLENNRNRNARRRISHLENKQTTNDKKVILKSMNAIEDKDSDAKVETIHLESKNMVKGDFNYIGLIFKENLIPKEIFLDLYWHSIIRCWQILEDDIKREREKGEFATHCQYFEELKCKAFEHKKLDNNYKAKEYELVYNVKMDDNKLYQDLLKGLDDLQFTINMHFYLNPFTTNYISNKITNIKEMIEDNKNKA